MDPTTPQQQPTGLQTVEQLISAVEGIATAAKSGAGDSLLYDVLPAVGVVLSAIFAGLSHLEQAFPQNHALLVTGAIVAFLLAVLSALGAAKSNTGIVQASLNLLSAFHTATTSAPAATVAAPSLADAPREAVALPDGTKVVVVGQAAIDALKQHTKDIINQQTRAIAASIPSEVVTLPGGAAVTVLGAAGAAALKQHVIEVTPVINAIAAAKANPPPTVLAVPNPPTPVSP